MHLLNASIGIVREMQRNEPLVKAQRFQSLKQHGPHQNMTGHAGTATLVRRRKAARIAKAQLCVSSGRVSAPAVDSGTDFAKQPTVLFGDIPESVQMLGSSYLLASKLLSKTVIQPLGPSAIAIAFAVQFCGLTTPRSSPFLADGRRSARLSQL